MMKSQKGHTDMDQIAIGKFISECRKEKHLTQVQLAERLGVTDRAVSKWETGKSMPDASIMLELCEQIGITVNDLLNARRIDMENYKEIAEKTMLEMREREERTARKMLNLEIVIGIICTVCFIVMLLCAAYFTSIPMWARILLGVVGFAQFAVGMCYSMQIEHDAGYYECPNCGERYTPSLKAMYLAPHMGRSRKLRCPKCNKRGYHKKVLTKDK